SGSPRVRVPNPESRTPMALVRVGLLDRLAPRRSDDERPERPPAAAAGDPLFSTKALRKFLSALTAHDSPVLLDLGPVVGSNVSFFGEQLGCKIFVEDVFADLDRHVRGNKLEDLPAFLKKRFPQQSGSVDGILAWDLIDYLDKPSAAELAGQLTRLLRPEGALLGFFGTAQPRETHYTKFIIADEQNRRHRSSAAGRRRQ